MERMLAILNTEGLWTVEVGWEPPGIWQGAGGSRTWACRYATVARWVYDNLHQGGERTLFAAHGNSGGSTQIAYALAHYGLGEVIDLACLSGGPPDCPICTPQGCVPCTRAPPGQTPEPLLGGNPQLHYPGTLVRFFIGDQDSREIFDFADAYFNAITSTKTMEIVPKTPHAVFSTQAGRDAILAALRGAIKSVN